MNPFTLRDYAGPDFFCNRTNETKRIISGIKNQRNLTLSSIRKMGKTGLIHHVFNKLDDAGEIDTVYVDVYYTESLPAFINKFGSAILTEKEKFSEKVRRMINGFIRNTRPTITFDNLTGAPSFSFHVENENTGIKTMEEIFGFLQKRGQEKPLVIAIDEFQQIANYPETNAEALLRTNIQKLRNVNFIFSGSDRQLIASMFSDAKRPFYQSTEFMHLEEIPEDEYTLFIQSNFEKDSTIIEKEALSTIMTLTRRHTYYVQYLCNKIYGRELKKITVQDVKQTYHDILKENEVYYSEFRDLLTRQQWELMIALAKEEGIIQVTSSDFIKKYDLRSPATVRRGIDSLIDKKMIYKKKGKYYVYDVFFAHWLQKIK